jgi:PhoH-like ATPase
MVAEKNPKKIYVLDTNVLVHDPLAFKNFEGAQVGIPSVVLEELDQFKREGTDRGRNAREFIRQLDELRPQGSLREGVMLPSGSIIKVLFADQKSPPIPFLLDKEDNAILLTAVDLKSKGYDVKFISKDLNARVKADALGVVAEDYLQEFVTAEEFYKGWVSVPVPAAQLKDERPQILLELERDYEMTPNQFILLESQNNPHNNRVFRYLGEKGFIPVTAPTFRWPLEPRNPQQLMALNLLLDDTIQFVTLLGPAGTGKTFLALLAALDKVLVHEDYSKVLVARPVVPLGRDIGYLPGTLEEKLHSWMLPIYDNMEFILHSASSNKNPEEIDYGFSKKKHKKHNKNFRDKTGIAPVDELVSQGKLSLEAITYMRGRSIPYQFILIDESQNLTPHEVKTIITRVGEGSKVVLVGDPYQIDSPYLDFASNGLVIASERFKGNSIFGSVFLPTSERSELSKLAGALL